MFESLKITKNVYSALLKNNVTRNSVLISFIISIAMIVAFLFGIITLQGLGFWLWFGFAYIVASIVSIFFWKSRKGKEIMRESWNIGWNISSRKL